MKKLLLLLCSIFIISTAFAQEKSIGISLSKNNIGLPFGNLFQPTLGPGFEIVYTKQSKNKQHRYFNAFLGSFFKEQDSGIYLGGTILRKFPIGEKFKIGLSSGLAYLHSFNLNEVYNVNNAPSWHAGIHKGIPSALLRVGAHFEYAIAEKVNIQLQIFEGVQIPYTKLVAGATRSSIQIGFSYSLNSAGDEK